MTVSTNAYLFYGVLLPDAVYPWEAAETDLATWWLDVVHGYVPVPQLVDAAGHWIGGALPPEREVRRYLDHRLAFAAQHPLPVTLLNCGSTEDPTWALAIPRTVLTAWRGFPVPVIEPLAVHVLPEDIDALLRFCETYAPAAELPPIWHLASHQE